MKIEEVAQVLDVLFLTSKVRLHCDADVKTSQDLNLNAFPDLKGQAPLRLVCPATGPKPIGGLFLTSKVRLHCDLSAIGGLTGGVKAFS